MAFHFGKHDPNTSDRQQGHRTGHAEDALGKTDHHRAPKEHAEKVQGIREREHGKQITGWGGGSDTTRKVT